MKQIIFTTILLFIFPIHFIIAGPTYIGGGTISDNHTWGLDGSPYVITGNLTISISGTLTIEPGVVVKFDGTTRTMTVQGVLIAQGTSNSKIVFTSYKDDEHGPEAVGSGPPSRGDWSHIRLLSDNSTLEHCLFRYGGRDIVVAGRRRYKSLWIDGSNPVVRNCIIEESLHDGIGGTDLPQGFTLENNIIRKCGRHGVNLSNIQNDDTILHGLLIIENQSGINLVNSSPKIQYCEILNNTRGIDVIGDSHPTIIMNQINENNNVGIRVTGNNNTNPQPIINNNNIYNNYNYNIRLENYSDPINVLVNGQLNWFNSTDQYAIQSKLYHHPDDQNAATLVWQPYLLNEIDFSILYADISGRITNNFGNPVSNAKVRVEQFPYLYTFSNMNGYYTIQNVPAPGSYTISASAFGYYSSQIGGVNVYVNEITENINITLTAIGDIEPVVVALEMDPNPDISNIMEGGTVIRYYRVIDSKTGTPLEGASVSVEGGVTSLPPFISASDGIVTIEIPDFYIGEIGDTRQFTINNVEGIEIKDDDKITFSCEIRGREFLKYWNSYNYARVGLGVGKGGHLNIKLGEENTGRTTLHGNTVYPNLVGEMFFSRQAAHSAGLSKGVSTPLYFKVNDVAAGANVSVGVDLFAFMEDDFKFDYELDGVYDAFVRYLVFARGNYRSLSNNLVRLLIYIEENLIDSNTLIEAYQYDMGGMGIRGYGQGFAGINNVPGTLGMNLYADLGAKVEVSSSFKYNKNEQNYFVSSDLNIDFGGKSVLSVNPLYIPDNPLLRDYSSEVLKRVRNPLINMGSEYNWMRRYSLGIMYSADYNPESIIFRNTTKSSWNYKAFNYADDYDGQQIGLTYKINVDDDTYSLLFNASEITSAIFNAFSGNFITNISNNTYQKTYENIFNRIGYMHETIYSNPIHYLRDSTYTEVLSDSKVNLGLNFLIKGDLDVGGEFREHLSALTEKGVWFAGEHYPLERYSSIPQLNTTYTNIVQKLLYAIPANIWQSIIDFVSIFNPFSPSVAISDYIEAYTIQDGQFTYFIGDNGSSITFSDGAISSEVDSIHIGSWSWWGQSPTDTQSQLSVEEYRIANYYVESLQEVYGLDYGIGGFYQFEPLNMGLNAPTTLTIVYSEEEIQGIDENTLGVYWEDTSNKRWRYIGGVVDSENNSVSVEIDTFRVFTLAPRLPGDMFQLLPQHSELYADSISTTMISSSTILNNDGSIVADGTYFTVSTTSGNIDTPDQRPDLEGIQVVSNNGIISFNLRSTNISGAANIIARSINGYANGNTSVAFIDTIPPPPPINVAVNPGDRTLHIEWNQVDVPDIGGYRVYYKKDSPGPPYDGTTLIDGMNSPIDVRNNTSLYLHGLENNIQYFITVRAYDISGNLSEYSEETTGVPSSNIPPGDIIIENVMALSDTSIYIAWIAPGASGNIGKASYYDIRFSSQVVDEDTVQWWEIAEKVKNPPSPSESGTRQSFTIWDLERGSTYYVGIMAIDDLGNQSRISISGITTSIRDITKDIPDRFELSQNYPNPFNPSTTIRYAIPENSQVTLEIYNVLGQKIATLIDDEVLAGLYELEWIPNVASGVYYYRIYARSLTNPNNRYNEVKSMIFLK